jgi:hypothetical protein
VTTRLRVAGWCLAFSVLLASALWFPREWVHDVHFRPLEYFYYLYVPAVLLGMVMSGNVHAPDDFLSWLAMVLENFALSLLAVKVAGRLRSSAMWKRG